MSVITIFYNAAAYLAEAIESVLSQDFGDFEYLLVDDGSTDASSSIALDYAQHDHRVRYLEHPGHANLGMSAARNLGLREARGEFVAFIDADDRWRPVKLREQVALLDGMPDVDAVGGTVNYWASHAGGKDRLVRTGHVRGRRIPAGEATVRLYPLGKAHAPSMSDLMLRRDSVLKAGGFEEAFRGAYEDQAFLAKFYLSSTLYFTDTVWSDYRIHSGSCMAEVSRDGTYHHVRRNFLHWFERHLATTEFRNNPSIGAALQGALKPYAKKRANVRDAARNIPLAVTLVRSGRSALRRLRPLLAPGPAILMYHRIAEESFDPWGLAVSPRNFEDQLGWISNNRTVLPLTEFADLHRQTKLPSNALAITFDDGYACAAKVAKPLLERFGIPATVFLSPDLIERGGEFWWDELERVVLDHDQAELVLYDQLIHLGDKSPEDRTWTSSDPQTARQHAYKRIYELLYGQPQPELEQGMEELRLQTTLGAPRETHRPLTPEEIQAVHVSQLEFGSHALTHPSLPLLDADAKTREIRESVKRCTELTGQTPRSFAYPYGDHEESSRQIVEQAGFLCACKADGWFVTRGSNPFALPRIFVGNWNSGRLARELGRP